MEIEAINKRRVESVNLLILVVISLTTAELLAKTGFGDIELVAHDVAWCAARCGVGYFLQVPARICRGPAAGEKLVVLTDNLTGRKAFGIARHRIRIVITAGETNLSSTYTVRWLEVGCKSCFPPLLCH
ncbi:hypothetical protein N658DRAFT_64034 [Parathielavia hyrcaniae]|uniref:Uncharacterized protein n=1 Tax=Parathielavia hyrcaniae TaxID=113614 RepID=A0AAN6Q0V8_9PEZI|nr:hypothetical protein N658DRAFT_64034 [Parathielavia hyrcaniae]